MTSQDMYARIGLQVIRPNYSAATDLTWPRIPEGYTLVGYIIPPDVGNGQVMPYIDANGQVRTDPVPENQLDRRRIVLQKT